MNFIRFEPISFSKLPSPCFVVDVCAVEKNLKILEDVAKQSNAKVLHALKAFSLYALAPFTNQYLSGTCSSGLHEALLAKNYYNDKKQEIHVYSVGYSDEDMEQLLMFANHIVFNSPTQLLRFASLCYLAKQKRTDLAFGLRINPNHSEGEVALYDPCAPNSRLGTTRKYLNTFLGQPDFDKAFQLINGLHFHTLCEQDVYPLQRTLDKVITDFGDLLYKMDWLNVGGGHHITTEHYQKEILIALLKKTHRQFNVQMYIEPGEAVAINTGVLIAEVLDITQNEMPLAILNISATCHMSDTLEMPYRANVVGAGLPNKKKYTYRLGGLTCLAGDVIGNYSFEKPLFVGQKIIFEDMSHYTMVKTSTFNGTKLPAIVLWDSKANKIDVVKTFGYQDFEQRL